MWHVAANIYLLHHSRSWLDSDGIVHANTYNLKVSEDFEGKFPFDSSFLGHAVLHSIHSRCSID